MKRDRGESHSAYAENSRDCRLYTIPHEIIMNIAQSFNDEQKISFALSSAKMYRTLGDAKLIPVHISGTAKAELQKKLKRDKFYANRMRLFITTKVGRKAWCAACAGLHPLRRFPPVIYPLSNSREQQLCFSVIDGGLKLVCRCCTLLTYDDVKAWIVARKSSHNSRHYDCVTYPGGSIQHPVLHVGPTGEVLVKACIQIYESPREDLDTKVRRVMVRLDKVFCPHMQSSDRKLIKKLLSQDQGVHAACMGQRIKCGECDTEISLHRRRSTPAGGMCGQLWIEKNLGRMKDNGDPVWRRHCQRN
jgi:hypothetical protein